MRLFVTYLEIESMARKNTIYVAFFYMYDFVMSRPICLSQYVFS